MIAAIRRYLPSSNKIVIGGSLGTITLAIALQILDPKKLKLTGVTLDDHLLAKRMRGQMKVTLRDCNVAPSDAESSLVTVKKLDLDKLYSLPPCRCQVLTLRGAHREVPAFVRQVQAGHIRLKQWEGMSYDDLRELTNEWMVSMQIGDDPDRFALLCAQLPKPSKCHLTLTDPAILSHDKAREAIADHHEKFARLSIPESEYEWPYAPNGIWSRP